MTEDSVPNAGGAGSEPDLWREGVPYTTPLRWVRDTPEPDRSRGPGDLRLLRRKRARSPIPAARRPAR